MNRKRRQALGAPGFLAEVGRRWYRPRWFAGLLAIFVIGANFEVVTGEATFGLRDFSMFGYPLAAHLQESLRAHELPLWNPLSECGHPYLAQWNTMVLYPFMLLAVLFPLTWSLGVFCLAHQYLGGLGMYFLARRWTRNGPAGALAAIIYAFDGIMQNSLMWPNNIAAFGLLPWVLWAVQHGWRTGGRPLLLASGLAALQLLTGAPEVILITWLFVLLVLAAERNVPGRPLGARIFAFRCVCIIGIAALLAAVQLIPFFDLLLHSERVRAGARVTSYLHWHGWANYLLPLFGVHGREPGGVFMHHNQIWTHSYYLSYLPWLLLGPALAGNRAAFVRNLAAGSALALILAMGPDGRLYSWLAAVLPFDLVRYPVKFLIVCKVAMPLLAAWGIKRLALPAARRRVLWSLVAVSVVFVVAVLLLDDPFLPGTGRVAAFADVPVRLAWLVLFGVGLLYLPRLAGAARSFGLFGLVIFVTAELIIHQPDLSPTVGTDSYVMPNPSRDQLAEARYPNGRALASRLAIERQVYGEIPPLEEFIPGMRAGLAYNMNLEEGIASAGGFYSLPLPHFQDVYAGIFGEDEGLNEALADFAAVARTTDGEDLGAWVFRPSAQPIVTVGREPIFLNPTELLERVREGRFEPSREILLWKSSQEDFASESVPDAKVSKVRSTAHQIEFWVETPKRSVASIAQVGYHWWRAEIDGQAVPIETANHAFQALSIPAGKHRIVLRYVDRGFQAGAILSLLALLVGLIGWCRLVPDHPRARGGSGKPDGNFSPF
jgi:hypothetical protein